MRQAKHVELVLAVGVVYEGVNEFGIQQIPLLAPQQGGVAEPSKKVAKHPLPRGRGGFPIDTQTSQKENHLVCVCFGGYATSY